MKNENKVDEMVDITSYLQQYVPKKGAIYNYSKIPGTGPEDSIEVKIENLYKILFEGDQLTAERVRGTQRVRQNSLHPVGCLERIHPSC